MMKNKRQRRQAQAFRNSPEELERREQANRNWALFMYSQLWDEDYDPPLSQGEMIRKTPIKKKVGQ